jgi:hypothetical protein
VTQFDRRSSIISLDTRRKLIRRAPLKHDMLRWNQFQRRDYHDIRKPTLSELGLTVTIGIAVKPLLGDFIVTVSDQRQSFQDVVQPVDAGMVKVARLTKKWGFLFAGGQAGYARTIRHKAISMLGDFEADKTLSEVLDAILNAHHDLQTKLYIIAISRDSDLRMLTIFERTRLLN